MRSHTRLLGLLAILTVSGWSLLPPDRAEARPAEAAGAAPAVSPPRPASLPLAGALFDNSSRMNVNNLDMAVTNHGSIAYDLLTGGAGLIFPRGSTTTAVFAAGLWVGARVGGDTRVAVAAYSQEFAPGPMLQGSYLPDSPDFRSYRIERSGAGYGDYMTYAVPQGAPLDAQGNPLLLGDAAIWSVFNDANPGLHADQAGATAPLGLEAQQTVFAFNRAGALGNIIFVKWRIANKGAHTLDDAYVSFWADPDLGGFTDDLVGCDTTLSMGYCYNATNADAQYATQPPAVGFRLLRGPAVPVSPGVYDTLGMTSFRAFVNGTDPTSAVETYNCMRGLHADGSPVHVNDDPSRPVTTFEVSGLHPENPSGITNWLDTYASDRRLLLSSGPFRMAPGDVQELLYAVVVGRSSDRLASIADLRVNAEAASLAVPPPEPRILEADLDLDPGVIHLASNAPWLTACIEPSGFDPAEIDRSTLRLAGSVPTVSKFGIVGDHDRDGIPDLTVKWSRGSLDPLLSPGWMLLGLTGSLTTGEPFRGMDRIRVIDPPSAPLTASVSPNPLNPAGILRFETGRPGPARAAIYDVRGRLVRVLVDTPLLPRGAHELSIDGRDGRGRPLGSGVYFFRIEAAGGSTVGRIAVLK